MRRESSEEQCPFNSDSKESDATFRRAERDWRELVRAGELIRRKALDSTFLRRAVCVEPPQICEAYSIQGRTRPLYRASNWGGVKKPRRRLRTPNLLEAGVERDIV